LYILQTSPGRFLENGNNGEKKQFVHAFENQGLCTVSALLLIDQHWQELNLPQDHPLAVFTTDGSTTGNINFIWKRISMLHLNQQLTMFTTLPARKNLAISFLTLCALAHV
jgi:hypothetical protein